MTNSSFEEDYFTILQSIEKAVDDIYSENPALLDFNVDKALNGAVRTLSNEKRGRKPPKLKLKADEQRIYDRFMHITKVYLGQVEEIEIEPITLDEMIACFKRIQRSIKLMSEQGRQGYLNFIQQFFGE